MGAFLYKTMDLYGRGLFFTRDWSLLDFKVLDFTERNEVSFDEVYNDMRESMADWEAMEDMGSYLKDMR
jgi:hypothetical protein